MTTLTPELQQTLLAIAYTSLCHGLEAHAPWPVDATLIDASLSELGACFVTLKKEGHLRGCIGSLEARQALAIADRGYVLVTGENRHTDTGEALLADPEVRKSFLGG